MYVKQALWISILLLIFSGCSDKDPQSNQSALYWYQQVVKDVSRNNLEGAGNAYTSLLGEHIRSPLLGEAMLIMADAHMNNEEYLLANYYLDEYLKRFGTKESIPYRRYQKLRANYYGLQNPKRDYTG